MGNWINRDIARQVLSRRSLLISCLGCLIAPRRGAAVADKYPSRAIKSIVPFSAGGIGDVSARKIAERLSRVLGQAVVIENRPGASGVIGLAALTAVQPDGHTLAVGASSKPAVAPALGAPVQYAPTKSFEPVILFGHTPMVFLAHPSVGMATVNDLVSLARRKSGELSFSTGGHGTIAHLAGEDLK